jgi:hypothetical protein
LTPYEDSELPARLAFVVGLVLAPLVYLAAGGSIAQTVSSDLPLMAAAGLLVGFGAVYGGGCTSGHGVCGLASLDKASALAVLTFMTTGIITANIVAALGGR